MTDQIEDGQPSIMQSLVCVLAGIFLENSIGSYMYISVVDQWNYHCWSRPVLGGGGVGWGRLLPLHAPKKLLWECALESSSCSSDFRHYWLTHASSNHVQCRNMYIDNCLKVACVSVAWLGIWISHVSMRYSYMAHLEQYYSSCWPCIWQFLLMWPQRNQPYCAGP